MLSELLFAAIYAMATEPDAFLKVSAALADEMGFRHCLLSLRPDNAPIELSINQPQIVTSAYCEHYFKLDPWTGLAMSTPFGAIIGKPDQDARFYDTEFYVDFARPMGVVVPRGVRMPVDGATQVIFGLSQSDHGDEPTGDDDRAMLTAGRHVQRALQLRQRFGGLEHRRQSMLDALDRVEFGMAITAADGRIHALNRAGEAAIVQGCGLRVHQGTLLASDGGMVPALAAMIRDASNGGAGGALRLRAHENRWTNVLVSPLPPQARWPQFGSRTLVAFRVADAPSVLDARLLISIFGLSRVEAQVAIALMDGLSLEEIALRRGVKPSTIKTQLDAIFIKTDTGSQRALVRLLGSLPALRIG